MNYVKLNVAQSARGPVNKVGLFDGVSELVVQDELISSDKFLALSKQNSKICYLKRDFLYVGGVWRGEKQSSALSRKRNLNGKLLLVGHSDLPTSKFDAWLLRHQTFIGALAGTNLTPLGTFSHALPLGVTNRSKESKMHEILGDPSHFLEADSRTEFCSTFSNTLYVNFTADNNKTHRGRVLKLLSSLPHSFNINFASPNFSKDGRVDYLARCRESNFVICPEGNGVDTHRLWEVLYMGGIPIIKSNPKINPLVFGLPVLILNDWNQLRVPEYLESNWHRLRSLTWDSNQLSQSWWNAKVSTMLSPSK